MEFNTRGRYRGELPEISLFDAIDELAQDYEGSGRGPAIRVSHWDPSPELLEQVGPLTVPPFDLDPRPYRYSYLVKRSIGLKSVLRKCGFMSDSMRGHVVENSTNAITLISHWLKARGITEVTLLTPTYFTPRHNLQQLGLGPVTMRLCRRGGYYVLPDQLPRGAGKALWLTSPVYSTGVYLPDAEIRLLRSVADTGTMIIADEALTEPSRALAGHFDGHTQFVGIYSPHKAVCVNGLKFSMVAFHASAGDSFDHWADVVCGGLSMSAEVALRQFLSPQFDDYRQRFGATIAHADTWHHELISRFGNAIFSDLASSGHFRAVYFPNHDARLGLDLKFHCDLLMETGCSIIPGQMNEFDPELGLSFRVNLARFSRVFEEGVERLYAYLAGRTIH